MTFLNDASRTSNPLQNNFLYSQNLFHYVASTISCDTNSASKLALPLALESDQKWCNLNIMPTVLWPLDFRHVVNTWLVLIVLVIWLSWPFIDDTTSDLQIACTKNWNFAKTSKTACCMGWAGRFCKDARFQIQLEIGAGYFKHEWSKERSSDQK